MNIEKIKRLSNGTIDVDFLSGDISPPKGSDEQTIQTHRTGQPTTHRSGHDHRQLRIVDAT